MWVRNSQTPAISHGQPKARNNAQRTDHIHVYTRPHTHAQGSVLFLFWPTDPFENLKFSKGEKKIFIQNTQNFSKVYTTLQVICKSQRRGRAQKAMWGGALPSPIIPRFHGILKDRTQATNEVK